MNKTKTMPKRPANFIEGKKNQVIPCAAIECALTFVFVSAQKANEPNKIIGVKNRVEA